MIVCSLCGRRVRGWNRFREHVRCSHPKKVEYV